MANGVNGPGETRNIQRSSSNPELHKQAADEVLNNLNKGLRHSRSYGDLPSTQGGSSSGGGNPSASMGGSGSNGSPERVSELNLSPLPYPNLEVHVAPVAVGRDSLHTPVKGPQPSATAASSPIRNTQLDNAEGLKNSIVLELKGALDLLEKPAWPIRLYGTPEQQVANKMVEIYDAHAVKTKAATQLDVFLEAFGEVLAEKAVEQPAVFHAFFQTHSGISHRESMISRFSNGFTHRLQEISGLRVSNNPFNVATATKQILHANIGGGDSCIQSMEKALEALGQGEISRSKADLICDLSGILMSATNGGDISARNSGIGTLKNALFESPKLASALHGTSVGSAIEAALTIEYTAKNTALGDNFSIQSISEPATQFHTTLKLATALDSLRPLENASNLNTCVMNQLDPPKPPEPPITLVPTREADLYLRITFPPMATDFSSVPTRAALDGSETAFKNSLMQLVGDVYPPSTGQNPAQQPAMPAISENLVNVLSLFFHKANTHSHDINNKKAVRLQELQAAFTEKLNTGITLPTIADSGDWQPAANSLRELNTAFVDLYRPGEAGYEEKKLALTELATTVMNRYRSVAGAGLQTATNLAITGSHDANLKTINTTLKQHADHQNAFLEIFANAPAEIPMQAAMEPICIDIQRPIDGLLTLKLEVANAKLNAATDTLKDSLKALYLALGKTPATASYEAPIEASQRKGAASASIRTDAGKNIQANTTSEAADTLSNQSRAIHHLADAYTYAKEQIAGAIQNTTSDIATSKTSEVTEDELAAKQKVLEDALTAALHRFATTTSGSGDDAVDGIRDTLKQNEADARRDGIGAIHDFAASGIKDRGEGESDATRLAYLLTQATRLGRFLPESTRTEVISLSASENDRIAALAKAAVIADIMTQKEVLHTTSTALTEFRSRRPDDAQDQAQETTRLATELSGLSELNVWSTDSEIKAYRDAMTAYRVAMASEMQALTVAEREDLASIDTLKKEHAGVVAQYNGQISRPHTPSVEFSRLSTALTTEGEKPHSSTMRDFISAIRADIRAIQASKTQKSEALETANVQFATATTDLEAKLRVFYTAIGADDTAAAIATAKATEAKTSAKVDGDPRIDVQTERTKEATALLTVETASIGELTTKYKAAIVDINAYSLVHEDATALEGELNKILAKFSNSGTPKEVFVYKRLEENISTEIGKATTAAKKLRDTALQNLDALKTELGTVLDRATKSMDERSALLQEAVGLLETISTETTRLFSDSKSEEGEPAHTALNQLSKKVETTYTRFCTTDSDAILAESRGNLGAIGTASSSGLTDIANGLSGGHSKRREAFNNAYTIEGLSLEPRGKRLATLDGFARQLSGAVAVRRAEFQTIRDTYRNATTTLRAAYETAIKDVDFDTVNAQDLRDKTSAFTAACEAAEQGMSTALQGIQPDENQPNVFDSAVTTAHENLKAAFTAGVSASFDTGKATLSALSDATPIAELTARVPMAVALKNRAADLSEFLNEGLLDAVNDITDAHFTLTLTAAEAIANVALAAAQTTAQTMTEPQTKTETPAQLTARMTEFDRAAREALDAFDTAVFGILDNPAGQNTLAALRRSIEARAAQTQTALKIAVSTPLETQRQSIATLLTRDGVTLADLNAAQGQVETLHRRSLDLGNTWVSNKAEIDQTLNAYDAKLGILKATRMAFTSAMKELTFVQKNPLDNTLTDKWSAIRDHEAQFKKLNQDYGHLLKEEAIDTDIAAAREACILRETAARDNLAPETDEILSAIPALLTTLPVDFDWTTTLATISEKLSPDQEIKATLTAAGQSIAGLEEAIRSQLIARDTVETAKKALIAWRPGQPLETVSTHYRNVLSLEKLTEAPFNASAFERGLAVQTYGIDTHVTAIQTLATPIRNTSLKDRWDDIYGQEQALGRLQALDPSKKNVQLQAQISDISTHLKGYAVPSDLERALFIQRLHGVLASSSLTPDQIRKEAQNNAQSEINNPKFQRAIQACHDGSSTLNDPIQKRLTYRQTLNTAEALVDRMADLDQTIGELTTALSNLAETPAEHIDFTSYDTYQKPRVDAATASISARIAELREHTRLLTAAVDTANAALDTARSTAENLTPRQVGTETAATLNARMTALDSAAIAALDEFNRAVAGLPENQARRDAREALKFRTLNLEDLTKPELQSRVSDPLQAIQERIETLLADPATTRDLLSRQLFVVQTLKNRRAALGDVWLTAGMGDTIDRTVADYGVKVAAIQTRAGQIRELTGALNGLNFAVPVNATLQDKWRTIKDHSQSRDTLMGHEDYSAIMAEDPQDPAITHSLTQLEARRTAAIANHAPEQRALIAGLAGQLDRLAAGFNWDNTLETAETTARNTLPVDMRANAEMQAALTTEKGTLNGLENAVRTRVTAREALTTARNSLAGWPASGRSLNDIRTEVERARATFRAKEPTMLLTDLTTEALVLILEGNLEASILRRDTLIESFQAIIATPLPVANQLDTPTTQLSEKWTEILRQVTAADALLTANVAGTGTGLIQDPQVATKIQDTRASFGAKVAVTDVERGAFRDALNGALLTYDVMVLPTADVLLDTAAVQMQDGLSVAIQANAFFRRAVAAVRVEGAGYQHALDERIGYRQGIAQANVLLGQVLRGEQLSQVLTNHLGRLAVPANNVVFGEFDRVMGRQLVDINTQFADHQQRVATATQGIQAAQRIIEGIPVAATAAGKWAGLNTANNNFFDALGNQGILWMRQSNGSHIYHPDIQVVVQAETAAFWQKVREVTPETTAIRNAAAASLSAFVAHGSTDPQPVFATLRDGLLDGLNIPPLARNVVETALAGLGIQAEIQSRVDLHVALRDLEDGTTSVTTASVSAIQDQITGLAIKASYTACDTILQTRLTKLSRAAHQAMAIDAINRNSSITKITQGGQTNALIRLAQDWRALENSFQTAPTQYKFRTTLDKAFDDLKIDPKSYIEELRKDYNAIKDQLPGVYQSSMDRALHQLHHRNGPPPLCAYALSAAIGTILEGIDIVADTRGIVTENGNSGPVHKHIAARAKDNSTFTGFADHGDTSVLRQVLNAQAWVMTDFNDIKTIGEDEFTNLMRWMTAPDTTMFTIANPGQVTAIEQLHFLDQIARSFPDLQVYTSSFVTDSGTPISVKNFYDDVWQKIMNESDELIQKYMRIQIQQLIDAMNRSR